MVNRNGNQSGNNVLLVLLLLAQTNKNPGQMPYANTNGQTHTHSRSSNSVAANAVNGRTRMIVVP